MELIFSFYEALHRKGPGSEASTRKALSLLESLPPKPDIVEFGCGSGAATLVLAEATGGNITAIDIHQPFLDDLNKRAAAAGSAGRIRTVAADMGKPPLPDGAFDLVWAEGAIYNIGFEYGLEVWRPLLRPGGYVAVTEATWLVEDRPAKAEAVWSAEYPAITDIQTNLKSIESAGFEPIAHFTIPRSDWADYFTPVEEQLAVFRKQHAGNADAEAFIDEMQAEVDMWNECGDSYGYVFYLARA